MDLDRNWRGRSALSRLDDWALVAGVIVAAIGAFVVLGWVIGTLFFLFKIAVAAVIFGLIFRAVTRRS